MNRSIWMKVIAVDMMLVLFAINVSVIGQMLGAIRDTYMLNLTQSSMLLSVQSIGGLVLAVLCILYIDAFNTTKVMVISGLALSIMLIMIGVTPPLLILFAIFALIGFAGGAVNTLTTSVLIETVPTKKDRFVIFMHMLFSLSAVIVPIVSQRLFELAGLSGAFFVIGGFGLCWAAYAAVVFQKRMRKKVAAQSLSLRQRFVQTKKVFSKRGMEQIVFISIFASCWQLGAIYYLSAYFTKLTADAADGAFALSMLFFGMMVSRLVYSRFAGKYSPGRVVLLTNVLGAFAWAGLFIVNGVVAKTVFVWLTGFFCANNFPIAFATACKLAPENSASASGFVTLCYYIATFSFIPIIGAIGDSIGLDRALIFAIVPLLLMIPAAFYLHRSMAANSAEAKSTA